MIFGAPSDLDTDTNFPRSLTAGDPNDSFTYDDQIVRQFVVATLFWALVASVAGLLIGILMISPQLFDGVSTMSFGRLRPVHTTISLYAFAANALFAAIYYSTQRLCKTPVWSMTLSQLHFWLWQAIVIASIVTIPLGITQGKEYAEMEWPIDAAAGLIWFGLFGVNFFMTLANRREPYMYISLWFYIATIISLGTVNLLNALVIPMGWGNSYSIFPGVQDAVVQWFHGYNVVLFLLLMPFLGLMYYFLPRATDRPIYSYKLAILNFWGMAVLGVWVGPTFLHYTAAPEWLTSIGMLASLLLLVPAIAGFMNGWKTMHGSWRQAKQDVVLMFFVAGLIFYGAVIVEGTVLGVKSVRASVMYSDWMIAHLHTIGLGWVGMTTFGMIYWLLPKLFQAKLWSPRAARIHFWLAAGGTLLYVVPIYAAGARQAWMWSATTELGTLRYPEFLDTILAVEPLWHLRLLGGTLFVVGLLIAAVNCAMTWFARPAKYHQPVLRVDGPAKIDSEEAEETSRLSDAPVLNLAKRLDVLSHLHWHRRWERLPVRFSVLVAAALALAALIQVGPVVSITANATPLEKVKPYTPLELMGRDIYISEGCHNCHSQMVRPVLSDTKRYGEYSRRGEFAFDHPFQWGTRRLGPDLARNGGKNSSLWLWRHLEDPQQHQPETIMPAYVHLLDTPIDYKRVPDRVHSAHLQGIPYEQELEQPIEMAKAQAERVAADIVSQGGPIRRGDVMTLDSNAVALIAYLQRLGADIFATPEAEAETTTAEAAAADGSTQTPDANEVES